MLASLSGTSFFAKHMFWGEKGFNIWDRVRYDFEEEGLAGQDTFSQQLEERFDFLTERRGLKG